MKTPWTQALLLSACVMSAHSEIHYSASFYNVRSPLVDTLPGHILVLMTYRAPVGADLPVGARAMLARLRGVWWGEVSTALRVDHGGAVPKALPALELPLLHAGAAGHTALWPRTGLPAERETERDRHVEANRYRKITHTHMASDTQLLTSVSIRSYVHWQWRQLLSKNDGFLDFCKHVLVPSWLNMAQTKGRDNKLACSFQLFMLFTWENM